MKISSLEDLRECGRRSKNYALNLLSEVAKTAASAIIESQPDSGTITIQTNGWKSDNTADYPAYYDIAIKGVKATDRADIIFISPALADNFGVSTNTETSADNIRIRAVETPTVDLAAIYWIIHTGEDE